MRILSYIFILLIILLGITFAGLNATPVTVNYYIGSSQLPLSMLLVLVLGIGAILGLLTGLCMYIRAKLENARLQRRIKHAEKEVQNLRAIPLKDSH